MGRREWAARALGWMSAGMAAGAASGMAAGAGAFGKDKREKPAAPMGVIAGSVFRETGFSFAGVEVVVVWELEGRKKKEWKGRTDSRGEFAFRVPAAEGSYAVRVRADGHARVLDTRGTPIEGLYMAGNDMHSVMGGEYPAPGITLGPALTFGWAAGMHLAHGHDEHA